MPFAQEKMGFSRPPRLFLRQDQQNAADPLGKTGFYDPQNESITLYITERHPKDIMRSLAHELQHHTQKCDGDFDNMENMGEEGYAQNNPHMRTMEIQAYQASIVFRDWEDSQKGTIYYEHLQKGDKSSMSTKKWKNRELNGLLMERFGFDFKPLTENLEEGGCPSEDDEDEPLEDYDLEEGGGSGRSDPTRLQGRDQARDLPDRKRPMEEAEEDPDRLQEVVRRLHNAGYSPKQIKESLTNAFNKAKKV